MLFCLTACEKDPGTVGPEDANLVVNVWQLQNEPFPSRMTRTDISQFSRLNYAVYDTAGNRIRQVNQKAGDESYGTAYFKVPAGRYQVVVVCHSSNGNPTMTNPAKIQFKNDQGFTDTFESNDSVELEEDTQVTVNAKPHRIVSLCRFVITDAIPEDVAKMRFQYKGGSGAFDASTGLGTVNSTQTEFFDVEPGKTQSTFDLYTFLHAQEETIHLQATAYDAKNNIVNDREFDIPMKRRTITKLSGPYFASTGAQIIVIIDIDDDWEGEDIITY